VTGLRGGDTSHGLHSILCHLVVRKLLLLENWLRGRMDSLVHKIEVNLLVLTHA
jgi:hypothetical protein